MDNLTHTLVGVAMANAGLNRKFGKGATLVLALASNLPDLDVLWTRLGLGDILMDRRMFSHSVLGVPVLSLLAAGLFRLRYKNISWTALFGLCLLAAAVHVLFDLINSFGVVALYPFSTERFAWAWTFIVDPVLWTLLALPLLLSRLPSRWLDLPRLSRLSLLGVGLYLALCAADHARAANILERIASQPPVKPERAWVFPEVLGPHRFRGVLKQGGEYRLYLIHVWNGKYELKETFPTADDAPAVQAVRASPVGQRLQWFYQAPVWRVREIATSADNRETLVEVTDLQFVTTAIRRNVPFLYRFRVANGKVTALGWR